MLRLVLILGHGKCTLFLAKFCKFNVFRYERNDDGTGECWGLGFSCRGGGVKKGPGLMGGGLGLWVLTLWARGGVNGW